MAHSTDYYESSHVIKMQSFSQIQNSRKSHGRILVSNFLRDNENWAIESLVSYLLQTYSDYLVDRKMIAEEIHAYIMEV